jgi:phage shock protein A
VIAVSIFKKIANMISGSPDTVGVSGEQAEEALNEFVGRMEVEVKKAKIDVAEAAAAKNVVEKNYTDICSIVDEYEKNAGLAAQRGEGQLAGLALKKAEESRAKRDTCKVELDVQEKGVEDLKALLASLEEKLDRTKAQRDSLLIRSREMEARRQINETGHRLQGLDSDRVFEDVKERADRMEAEANAIEEIDRMKP